MSFLHNRVRAAAAAAQRGDGDACRRILDHAVAEDPTAIEHLADAVRRLPEQPTP